ncbi:MAG: aldolase/citrate lyase family protein [Pirellulales bacterium]
MAHSQLDPFVDSAGRVRLLRGVGIQTYAPRAAELAGMLGFETIWIDVEHGPSSYTEVELLLMAAESAGCCGTVRIPNNDREHILRALEVGTQILVVPMIDNAEQAKQIVHYGKFPPLGRRGFNLRSRGLQYGLSQSGSALEEGNQHTHLFAQIESLEAVKNVEAICQVEGLDGIVIGPGDLSADMGRPGQFTDPELIDTVASVVRTARSQGKHAGLVTAPGPLLDAALAAGCDLSYCGSDLGSLSGAWNSLLDEVPSQPSN